MTGKYRIRSTSMHFHNLLVVDWDYFFRDLHMTADPQALLYDWGHAETPMYIEALWPNRAAGFIRNGIELPVTTGLERDFWSRFKFSDDAKLYFADSNASAANTALVGDTDAYLSVWLYDAHHDSGYHGALPLIQRQRQIGEYLRSGMWACDYWMVLYDAIGAGLHVRYPAWKTWAFDIESEPLIKLDRKFDDGSPPVSPRGLEVEFDRVFVCRSGAWVPPWLDADFFAFLERCPVRERTDLTPGGLRPREFDMQQVQVDLDLLAEFNRRLREPAGA